MTVSTSWVKSISSNGDTSNNNAWTTNRSNCETIEGRAINLKRRPDNFRRRFFVAGQLDGFYALKQGAVNRKYCAEKIAKMNPDPQKKLESWLHLPAHDFLIVLDLDGAVHKGIPLLNPRGYSNLDLVWNLMWKNLQRPVRYSLTAFRMLRLNRLDKKLMKLKTQGACSMSHRDEKLIRSFVEEILSIYELKEIQRAGEVITKYAFPFFFDTIRRINEINLHNKKKTHLYFISKAFRIILEVYADKIQKCVGLPVNIIANELKQNPKEAVLLREEKGILTQQNKIEALARILAKNEKAPALIMGDTEEDAGMMDYANRKIGPEYALGIAINSKDNIIKNAADITVPDWKTLLCMLKKQEM